MASDDDDDAYLYSDEEPVQKKPRIEPQASGVSGVSGAPSLDPPKQSEQQPELPQSDEGSSNESESEDDVEFVIEDSAAAASTVPSVNTTVGPLNDAISEVTDAGAEADAPQQSSKKPEGSISVQKNEGSASLDINGVANYEGKPLTQLDLDTLKEKPWRAPGADISDYFNYGFDEFTWTAYCHKQDSTRGEFNPQKVMAKMMSGPGGKGVFPFPFMPMQNMPMPNMPMPNMPMPMPNVPMQPNMPKQNASMQNAPKQNMQSMPSGPSGPSGPKKSQNQGNRNGRNRGKR